MVHPLLARVHPSESTESIMTTPGTAPYTPDKPLSWWERLTARYHYWRARRIVAELHADVLHDFGMMTPEEQEQEVDAFLWKTSLNERTARTVVELIQEPRSTS